MTIKELIKELKNYNPDSRILASNDEELNTLYWGFEIAELSDSDNDPNDVVIFPLSGQEINYCFECDKEVENQCASLCDECFKKSNKVIDK